MMEKIKCYLISTLIILLGAMLIGCTERVDDPTVDGEVIKLRFTCVTSQPSSRSAWNEPYDEDAAWSTENTISMVDVLWYTVPDSEPVRLSCIPDKNKPNTFVVTIGSDSPCVTHDASGNKVLDGRMVIIANAGMNNPPLDTVIFYQSVMELWGIPMWGVKQFDNVPVNTAEVTHLDTVEMLRAMSKITVKLSDSIDEGYTLDAVTLTSYPERGDVVPVGASAVSETGELDLDECFNPVNSLLYEPLDFTKVADSDNEYVAYVPEMESPEKVAMMIQVNMSYLNKKLNLSNPYVHFVEYSDGSLTDEDYNLVRNHHYIFSINRVSTEMDLEFTVCEWDNKSADITFD